MQQLALRPFQRTFLAGALAPGIDTAALSIPRGNGKSHLAAHILTRALTPGDPLNVPGAEYLLSAASIEQSRLTYRPIRGWLEPTGAYRFIDSAQRIGITHKPTNTRLRVLSSSGKRAMGVVGVPLWVMDEPGSYETVGGELMYDAAMTAQGKPGSPLRVLMIGTLAPSLSGWWHDLVEGGSRGSVYVQALRGDPERWDQWPEIRRCNPLTAVDPAFRAKLLEERDEARADTRLKARFLSYRLNLPSPDESEVLLTVDDWRAVLARPVPEREGRPVVGIDLGAGRAWSAAVAVWRNGRTEAVAVAPGIPSIEAQERRDRVPGGTYLKLIAAGSLMVSEGLRVPPARMLVDAIRHRFGAPEFIVCDRFRLADLQDTSPPCQVVPRVTRWSEASHDIRALRQWAKDGPLACDGADADLLTASLSVALVKSDDQGSVRLAKRGTNNEARDDVAAALTLATGAVDRLPEARPAKVLAIV